MGLGAFALRVTHVWDVLGFCDSVICKCVLLRGDARMWFGFEALSFRLRAFRTSGIFSGFELRLIV